MFDCLNTHSRLADERVMIAQISNKSAPYMMMGNPAVRGNDGKQ